jgi:hypothetical protein
LTWLKANTIDVVRASIITPEAPLTNTASSNPTVGVTNVEEPLGLALKGATRVDLDRVQTARSHLRGGRRKVKAELIFSSVIAPTPVHDDEHLSWLSATVEPREGLRARLYTALARGLWVEGDPELREP